MKLIAHRGASARFPENTLAAIRGAFDAVSGADGVECDVQLTADGVPVVFHDKDMARLTGREGLLDELTWAELASYRVDGHPIPTLEEVAGAIHAAADASSTPLVWNVELKTTPRFAALVDASVAVLGARRHERVEVVVSSFDPRIVMRVQATAADRPVALLYEDLTALRALAYLPDADTLGLHPRHDLVTAAHLETHARAGRVVRAWTVDAAEEARRLRGLNVDAIITNRPGSLRAELELTP